MYFRNDPLARKTELVEQDLNGELLIYDLTIHKAYCLNETSAQVYKLCDGKTSITDIGEKLSKQFKQNVSDDLVWLALDGLKKNNLLENGNELVDYFAGTSRREVIKRVGFSAMIALPIIFSLVAPMATMAASTCVDFLAPCTGGGLACCPQSLCAFVPAGGTVCTCRCANPGQCLSQTGCPSTTNCNPSGVCAP